ncbi:MAG: DNA polymerase III subunit gamma/tau [Chloroflexi bacterium]|nr:DNA polymerase III subunit gamma/tau [Chloroflexota bacterium]
MSEVFYRKWRPRILGDVVGQDSITHTLRQAVVQGKVAHAYLFCGSRGTGKTSTARILAKAVNCLSPENGEPDNQCSICVSMNEGRALDLIEIDAASNRGIDDIRSLSDKIRYSPNEARYKVYIIDEVHMLTEPAFNALLKTLEEPPSHAIFILATTEAHKVPLTIISRCQRFEFRRIPLDRMIGKLEGICKEEGVEVSPEAFQLIARASNGGLRDAENLLEQVIVSYGSPISEENVRDLLGLGGDEMALELVGHIVGRSIKEGLTLINEVAGQGNDLRQLHRGTMEFLRAVLLLKTGAASSLGYPDETLERLVEIADSATLEHTVLALKTFGEADFRRDTSSTLPLELAMVQSSTEPAPVAAPQPARPVTAEAVRERPASAPSRPSPQRQPSTPNTPSAGYAPPPPRPRKEEPVPATSGPLPEEAGARLEYQWRDITGALRRVGTSFKVGGLLIGTRERQIVDGAVIVRFPHRSNMERMEKELEDPETRRKINEVLTKAMGSPYELQLEMANGGNGASGQSVAQRSHLVRAAQSMGASVLSEKEEEER